MKIELKIWMPVGIAIAILFGIVGGFWFGEEMKNVAWIGKLFLHLLKMVIVPLIMSSLIVGIAKLGDIRSLGRVGMKTLFFYLVTMGIAVLIGLSFSNLFPFHSPAAIPAIPDGATPASAHDFSAVKMILGMVPENVVRAMAEGNILPLIVFSILFGGVLSTFGKRGKPVLDFFTVLEEIMMKMIHLILWVSPIGIFGLIGGQLGEAGGGDAFLYKLWSLRFYVRNVLVGLLVHGLIVLPLFLSFFGRRNPFRFLRNMATPLVTAFSTASSSATLPVTMETIVESNDVSRQTAGFVLPLGATVNMDGTALYEAAAAMFIAQLSGHDLGLAEQLVVFMTATFAAIGAAGIPEAGLVTLLMVLNSVQLPLESIGLLLTVDWFLDRCRTTVNVWGDSVVAAIIDRDLNPLNR